MTIWIEFRDVIFNYLHFRRKLDREESAYVRSLFTVLQLIAKGFFL